MSYVRNSGQVRTTGRACSAGSRFFPPVIKALLISNVAIWLLLDVLLPPFTLAGVPIFAIFSQYLALWPLGAEFLARGSSSRTCSCTAGSGISSSTCLPSGCSGWSWRTPGARGNSSSSICCAASARASPICSSLRSSGQAAPTVGASGAVFGVLIAFGMLFPDRPIYIYFLLPDQGEVLRRGLHRSGAVLRRDRNRPTASRTSPTSAARPSGFVYLLADMNLIPVRGWWARLRGGSPAVRHPPARSGRPAKRVRDAKFYDINTGKPMHDDRRGDAGSHRRDPRQDQQGGIPEPDRRGETDPERSEQERSTDRRIPALEIFRANHAGRSRTPGSPPYKVGVRRAHAPGHHRRRQGRRRRADFRADHDEDEDRRRRRRRWRRSSRPPTPGAISSA